MSQTRPRILLVEDSPLDRKMVQVSLGDEFEVVCAESGQQALRLFEEVFPDLIVLDYILPDCTGLELLERFVKRRAAAIMLTGKGNENVAVRAMKLGAMDYLCKSDSTSEDLRVAVRAVTDKWTQRCAARPRVLLIDDDLVDRRTVRRLLHDNFQMIEAQTGKEGRDLFDAQRPDCVLLDYSLPDFKDLTLLEQLVEAGATVIMLTGKGNTELMIEAANRGAVDYVSKPSLSAESLSRAIHNALQVGDQQMRAWASRRRCVLVIDDDEVDRLKIHRLIGDEYSLVDAASAREGLRLFRSTAPDCVLLDYRLPDVEGFELLRELTNRFAAVIMLTGQGSEETAVQAMKHGAQDYLQKDKLSAETLRRGIENALKKADLQRKINQQQTLLRQHAEDLERSNQELQQFAYVASHDLQEPLRSVSSFCGLLRDKYRGKLDETADRWMDKIVRGATRMKTMIQDLLAYSRVETSGKELKPTDCNQVCRDAIANLRSAIQEADARVEIDTLPTVMADASQIVQLLQNLIGNAVKYRDADPPVVRLSAKRVGDQWRFSVSDNGIGIAPEHHERIFQMFKRLHGRDAYPGTGIGLSLCQRIVHRHGGRIWLDSEPGKGSTFYFTIAATPTTDTKETMDEQHEFTCSVC